LFISRRGICTRDWPVSISTSKHTSATFVKRGASESASGQVRRNTSMTMSAMAYGGAFVRNTLKGITKSVRVGSK
jgi:hypothetical protein